jgi:hypothetical protein
MRTLPSGVWWRGFDTSSRRCMAVEFYFVECSIFHVVMKRKSQTRLKLLTSSESIPRDLGELRFSKPP